MWVESNRRGVLAICHAIHVWGTGAQTWPVTMWYLVGEDDAADRGLSRA